MSKEQIAKLFGGIDKETTTLLAANRAVLAKTLRRALAPGSWPPADKIFNAFRLTPISRTRVVLLGQNPAVGSEGLSFFAGGRMTPSLHNIVLCLRSMGLCRADDDAIVADGHAWARQGVLLLNASLTSPYEPGLWDEYMNALIADISRRGGLVFILFGGKAREKAKFISANNKVLCWGHPSPQNFLNNDPADPHHFAKCDAFTLANEYLAAAGKPPIDWDLAPAEGGRAEDALFAALGGMSAGLDRPWIFVDGGAKNNGGHDVRASYACVVITSEFTRVISGRVEPVDSAGGVVLPSNNRGELTALATALEYIARNDVKAARIYADSEYAIKSVGTWCVGWRPADLKKKKNVDLILPARKLLDGLVEAGADVEMIHVRSHRPEPARKFPEWLIWKGNQFADAECTAVLR